MSDANQFENNIPPEKLDDAGNYILSDEEKKEILDNWNAGILSLPKLIRAVWKNDKLDGRSFQGRALKRFLASRDKAPIPSHVYIKKTEVQQLSEEDKAFIREHAKEFKARKISQLRWGENVGLGDVRVRLCKEYYESLPPEMRSEDYNQTTKDYTPPKTPTQVLARLKNYRICDWEDGKMSVFQKECVKKLIEFSNIPRFESDMSTITNQKERDLVEAEFFRHVYDKPDLTSEDLSTYISACFCTLDIKRLRAEEVKIAQQIEESVDDDGKPKFNQAFVDYASSIRSEISNKTSKLEATFKSLNGDRSNRLKNKGNNTITLASFVELLKEKDKRDKVMALIKRDEEKLKEEMAELASMEALKFEMWGANPRELLH